jgi:hypothetical protein
MRARHLAIQNFSIAEHLLQLHQLFRDLKPYQANQDYVLAICTALNLPQETALQHAKNSHMTCSVHGAVPMPSCLTTPQGTDFLLRQSVLVSCSALESFFWDILRENALTVVKARGRNADDSLRNVTLTLDDYLSLQEYADPDERLKQIILNRFERGTLYDSAKIDEIVAILTVRHFWKEVKKETGLEETYIRNLLTALIKRRNAITHRADRPIEGTAPEDIDAHGLSCISYAWASTHFTNAKTFVLASSDIIGRAVSQLESIINQKEEQRIARQTQSPTEP